MFLACQQVTNYQSFEEMQQFSSSDSSILDCLALMFKVFRFLEKFVTLHQSTRRDIAEDLNLQQHLCAKLKYSVFLLVRVKRLSCSFSDDPF
jgi:hypothetical protein